MTNDPVGPAVLIEDLDVARGGRQVLSAVSCAFPAGAVTGLLGPSGSGKTTLMRAIVGVQQGVSGRVTVLGLPAGSAELRQRIGYMTQAVSVYRDLTVLHNVAYFARLLGVDRTRVDAVIEEVGLSTHRTALASRLSGGQLSRVSLACALVADPDLLVLDEPTVGQDPVLREELWAAFRRRADAGATVVVSSHVMDEARRCDDLLVIREGRVVVHESPEAVLRRAGVDDFDAAFLTLIRRDEGAA